jgi:hypothetical protein
LVRTTCILASSKQLLCCQLNPAEVHSTPTRSVSFCFLSPLSRVQTVYVLLYPYRALAPHTHRNLYWGHRRYIIGVAFNFSTLLNIPWAQATPHHPPATKSSSPTAASKSPPKRPSPFTRLHAAFDPDPTHVHAPNRADSQASTLTTKTKKTGQAIVSLVRWICLSVREAWG